MSASELLNRAHYEVSNLLALRFAKTDFSNLDIFVSQSEAELELFARRFLWRATPSIVKGSQLLKHDFLIDIDGQHLSISGEVTFPSTIRFTIAPINFEAQFHTRTRKLLSTRYTKVQVGAPKHIVSINLDLCIRILKQIFEIGYKWIDEHLKVVICGEFKGNFVQSVFDIFRKETGDSEILDDLNLCAIPGGKSGHGMYLIDNRKFESMKGQISIQKRFSDHSVAKMVAEIAQHRIPYSDMNTRKVIESNSPSKLSLDASDYRFAQPSLVDAEIALYGGINELAIPVISDDNCHLIACVKADTNLIQPVTQIIEKIKPEIKQRLVNGLDNLFELDEILSARVDMQTLMHLLRQQEEEPPVELNWVHEDINLDKTTKSNQSTIPKILTNNVNINQEVKMTIIKDVGDGSIIINESIVLDAFKNVQEKNGKETAEALKLVYDEVEKSGNKDVIEVFNSFTEELNKPTLQKPTLRALWHGIVTELPSIERLTGAIEKITKIFI